MVENVVNIEAKINLQLFSGTKKIDSIHPNGYKPSAKKNKDKANQEYQDGDKAKPYNLNPGNISQP